MVHIAFDIDESELSHVDPISESPAVIQENLFQMPVYFVVEGTNILELPNGCTAPLSIVGFVWKLRTAIKRLKCGGHESFGINCTGTMHLQDEGEAVRIWTTGLPIVAKAKLEELRLASEELSSSVENLMIQRFPLFPRHPQWGFFFRDI